jgi:hypothetical protein
MASLARIGFVIVTATVALGPVVALAAPPPPPPSTAHGENFLVKSAVDSTFCMDMTPGATNGLNVVLNTCTTTDTQRFAFTWNADGSNAIINSQGMCVDARQRKAGDGLSIRAWQCHFGDNERYSYNAAGQIVENYSGLCLSVPGAVNGAAVSLVTCDSTKNTQLWKLAH